MEPQRDTDRQEGGLAQNTGSQLFPLVRHVCKSDLPIVAEKLKTYSKSGWPRCCGEVMYCGPAKALEAVPSGVTAMSCQCCERRFGHSSEPCDCWPEFCTRCANCILHCSCAWEAAPVETVTCFLDLHFPPDDTNPSAA